jgi:type II secretory pathway pseudopilin PulG
MDTDLVAFDFTCPYCHLKTRIDDRFAGRAGPCAGCGKEVEIPNRGSTQTATAHNPIQTHADARRERSRAKLKILLIRLGIGCIAAMIIGIVSLILIRPAIDRAIQLQKQTLCLSNLQQIARALDTYYDEHGSYPTPTVVNARGKPLYSWRVLILPQLGYQSLYDQFALDQTWDSPGNFALTSSMPRVFASPGSVDAITLHETNYVLLVGTGTLFPSSGPLDPDKISDDPSETILLCETGNAGNYWTEPRDINAGSGVSLGNRPMQSIGGNHAGSANAITVDGTPLRLPSTLSQALLDAMISPNGNESIEIDDLVVDTVARNDSTSQ